MNFNFATSMEPKAVWTTDEKHWLAHEYTNFENQDGHNKMFRTKRDLYKYLSQRISACFTPKSEQQIANRVQTIIRQQKSMAVRASTGLTSGRLNVPIMVDRHRTTGVVKPVQVVKTSPDLRIITQSVAPVDQGITEAENGSQNDPQNDLSEPKMEVDVDETTAGDLRRLYCISGAVRYIGGQGEGTSSGASSSGSQLPVVTPTHQAFENVRDEDETAWGSYFHGGTRSTDDFSNGPTSDDMWDDSETAGASYTHDNFGTRSSVDASTSQTLDETYTGQTSDDMWNDETAGVSNVPDNFGTRSSVDASTSQTSDDTETAFGSNNHEHSETPSSAEASANVASDTELATGQAYDEIWVGQQSTDQWTIEESKYVLDFYEIHMNDIGPLKTFRNKKEMWEELAIRLHGACDSRKTAAQVSRRFDAMMKKKKEAVNKNKVSGAGRTRVEFQEELDKIAANDDSIDPEVIRGVNFVKYKEVEKDKTAKKPRWDKPNKKGILQNLSETMMSIEKRKENRDVEKNKQRDERHKSTMELLTALLAKNNAP